MDLVILAIIVWVGCFLVVAVDSAFRSISPWFWRLAYGLVREKGGKQ